MKKRKWIKLLLIILALVVLGIVFTFSFSEDVDSESASKNSQDSEVIHLNGTDNAETEEVEQTADDDVLLCVHVCGEVANPDVYYLKSGSRVHEAVSMAGGLTENADANYINMAQPVTDGQQIYIPSKEETAGETYFSASNYEDDLLNINTADVEDLMELPGIGEAKAEAIVEYRKESGGFNSIEEIKNVSGIGDSLFEEIKSKIKV